MKLKIVKPDNPCLRNKCITIEKRKLQTRKLQHEINTLLNFIYGKNNKGEKRNKNKPMTVGLSANQVGLHKQISIVDLAIGKKMYSDIHVLINPQIIWHSKTLIERTEGCVNLPNIWGYVKRHKKIKVKALDRSGNNLLITCSGWAAILLQHEIGHLNGELFIDKMTNPKKAHFVKNGEYKQYKKEKKLWKHYKDISSLVKHHPQINSSTLNANQLS